MKEKKTTCSRTLLKIIIFFLIHIQYLHQQNFVMSKKRSVVLTEKKIVWKQQQGNRMKRYQACKRTEKKWTLFTCFPAFILIQMICCLARVAVHNNNVSWNFSQLQIKHIIKTIHQINCCFFRISHRMLTKQLFWKRRENFGYFDMIFALV